MNKECGAVRSLVFRFGVLASLCLLAYWPFLRLPLISDDYIQIHLGRIYGPVEQWGALAQDALYRCRATSILLTHWTEALLDVGPLTFGMTSLALHFVNTILVFFLGMWKPIGYRVSFLAACFFAVYQRPQEAVIWYAALPELLVFTFVLAALLCWFRYAENLKWEWYAAATACYVLALLSKESAVVFAPLALGALWIERRRLMATAPFFGMALVYFLAAHAAKSNHLHFNDGTFSLTAPFALTIARSIGRMMWFWGGIGIGVLLWYRRKAEIPWVGTAILWMVVTLLPYSFLTYQGAVPSRHTYLASVGIAFVVARAFLLLQERFAARRMALAAVAVACISFQILYLWIYKLPQYVERAKPTEELLRAVQGYNGPVQVTCFPYATEVAQRALEISTAGTAWLEPQPDDGDAAPLLIDACRQQRN